MRILVVEDEPKVAAFVRSGLEEQGYAVTVVPRGEEAPARLGGEAFDAMLLDIMLPGQDGLSLLRQLRAEGSSVPVILLTARGDLEERVEGLNLGADDYLAKPFALSELLARLRAVVRRRTGVGSTLLVEADLTLNIATREVKRGGRIIALTPREFSLLECLLRASGRLVTRTEIIQQVWGYSFDPGTNVLDVAIQRLRRKIDDGFPTPLIQTERGVGYQLKGGM
ncbi:MAG: hypothetical protein RLZZ129_2676 [Verrucomicrobiota bacterium]|jgi:DNA-binding response OmpR family regulator